MVRVNLPLEDSNEASVGVNVEYAPIPFGLTVIELTPALTNLWIYATSVTPIETVVPVYPDPWKSVLPIPTEVIVPVELVTAVTDAPTRGAIPKPPLDPIDIICPALGNWFWFIVSLRIIRLPLVEVIPLNT